MAGTLKQPTDRHWRVDAIDQRHKWGLLVASVGTLALLVAAALEENVYTEWGALRGRYAEILDAKADEERGRAAAERFVVEEVEQNVLPGLGTVDRCITCHPGIEDPRMADQPNPFRTHPGRYLRHHPPERFGCTVCHRGQGRALVFAEAKAEGQHWDYPFLDEEYLQAECGRCHQQLSYAEPGLSREGERLLRESGCPTCHAPDGKGAAEGPDLSDAGLGLIGRSWWKGHPSYPTDMARGRPALAAMSDATRQTLQQYLLTRHGADRLAQGQWLYTRFGCGGCHKVRGVGGMLGPDLTSEGRKVKQELSFAHVAGKPSVANWIYEHFLDPARVVPGSRMPRLEMRRDEAQALTTLMLSLRADPDLPQRYVPEDATRGPASPAGEETFRRYCSACHGTDGAGRAASSFGRSVPGVLNADYLRIATTDYIREVVIAGRPGRDMPAWRDGLDGPRLEAVLAFVESRRPLGRPFDASAMADGDAQRGARVFASHCDVCHGSQGEGGIGPKLRSASFLSLADDRFLYETITSGRPDTAMPVWADLPSGELSDLLALLRSWREELGARPPPAPDLGPAAAPFAGQPLFARECGRCHGARAEGGPAVALHNGALLRAASDAYLAGSLGRCREDATARAPGVGPPGALGVGDLGAVTAYLRSLQGEPLPVPRAEYRRFTQGSAQRGAALFATTCAGCHGTAGRGGIAIGVGERVLLEAVSDGFLAASIALGRDGTVMEPRGLNAPGRVEPLGAGEILDLVAYLRSLANLTETTHD